MSWLGVKYALLDRDERVKGGTRLVYVVLGARIEYRRITTSPTSLGELRWLTLMSAEQIRRILDDLEDWKKVRRLSRGKNAVYALPGMAGPLFAMDTGDPVKMTDFVIDTLPKEIGQHARKVTGRMTGFRRPMTDFSGRPAGGVLFSEVLRTEVLTTTATRAGAGDSPATVLEFLQWWRDTYPLYADGARSTADVERDGPLVEQLLRDRTLFRLQEMAIVLWLVDAREERWIADSDRSIRVLRHKADWLDRRAASLPAWWHACAHRVKCADRRQCEAMEAVG